MAKLLVVLPALERGIQNRLRKAILRRRAGGPVDDPNEIEDAVEDPRRDEIRPPARPPQLRREAPLAPRGNVSITPGDTPPCDPTVAPCR